MKTLFSFLVGIGIGMTIGLALVALFSPVSGAELKANWQSHVKNAKIAAQQASANKRAELQAELKKTQQPQAKP